MANNNRLAEEYQKLKKEFDSFREAVSKANSASFSSEKISVENVRLNKFNNFEILTGDAKVQLENLIKAGKIFDVVIVDPPRKGLAPEAVEEAYQLSKNLIIYVSCNPSTLARDLKLFSELGAKVEYVQPVDMFCHTFHIENVALIRKN